MSEHDEQTSLIEWTQWVKKQIPELEYLYAYPSGQLRPQQKTRSGKRFSVIGKRLKAEGVRAGMLFYDIISNVQGKRSIFYLSI